MKTNTIGDGFFEQKVADTIIKCKAEGRVLFSSFNPAALGKLKKILPNVPRALLVTEEDEPENKMYLKKMWLAWLAKPHIYNLHHEMFTEERAAKFRRKGLKVALWTVNNADMARKYLALGAESIISDTPNLL